jgi:hypothetical protein
MINALIVAEYVRPQRTPQKDVPRGPREAIVRRSRRS